MSRSLASASQSIPNPSKNQTIKEVLQKLKGGSLTVKKVKKDHHRVLQAEGVPSSMEPFLKMKMEVLDEEVENIPAEDFVQYNDTDDEDAQREARKSFRNIAKVNIKESFSSGGESDDGNDGYDEPSSGDDFEPPKPAAARRKKGQRRLPTPRSTPRSTPRFVPSVSPPKNIVINLKDPCQFVCVTCKGKFGSFEELQTHLDESLACKKTNSTCNVCGKICPNRRALSQHKLTHGNKQQFVCDQCGKVYTNTFNLENHKSQIHGDEAELGYVYKCCELTFTTRKDLAAHTATHTKLLNLLCDVCGKNFTSHKALKSHSISHTNIRPFPCNMCDKAFRTRLLLIQHSHVHTGIKAFSCDVCEKAFAKKESLRKHYRQHSTEPVCWSSTGEKLSVKPIEELQQLHPAQRRDSLDHDHVQEQLLPIDARLSAY